MGDPGSREHTLPESVIVAQAIRDATLRVPGVVEMSRGRQHREATYGPGITVWGVGLSSASEEFRADVHVIARAIPLLALAQRVRRAVQDSIRESTARSMGPVNIYIDDIEVDEQPTPGSTS